MKTYAVINSKSTVVENVILWDGETEWAPPEGYIALESDVAGIGWKYLKGELVAPPAQIAKPTPEEILAKNTTARDYYLRNATLAVAPLQDAVDLDDATTTEIDLLKKWKQYRVAVNRVDLTKVDPVWPTQP